MALSNAVLYRDEQAFANNDKIWGTELENLSQSYLQSSEVLQRLSLVIDRAVLLAIASGVELKLGTLEETQATAAQLVSVAKDKNLSVEAKFDEEHQMGSLAIKRVVYGNIRQTRIDAHFVNTADYAKLIETAKALNGLIGEGARVTRENKTHPVKNFEEAIVWLMQEASSGIAKQRYKGLGEMNAEQLAETTMQPENRRLLRVRLEDAASSDNIFSMLMGDNVEPRRAFIEDNALFASNIDV
jgi:DNA gyrase subunit B